MSKTVDYDEEKKKIIEFLRTFYQDSPNGTKEFVYSDQIMRIAQREQLSLYINLEDVHNDYTELADAIRQNTTRYNKLFYDAVDDMVHELNGNTDVSWTKKA
jgi:DNA replication licensing factor MCM7